MKQKIVVKVLMTCEKCRSKALQVAAVTSGVNSVSIEGPDKDRVVVIGDGVDTVCLTTCLRKKVGHAVIISVEEVKEKPKPKPEPIIIYPAYPQFISYEVVRDPYPGGCCQM